MTIEDVLLTGVQAGIVVLNGCETGKEVGKERMSLAVAFLMAGAKSVVAGDSKIDDGVASRLMLALYDEGLDENPSRAAQRVPESWGTFRVHGRR
jgi:CHAT domain-containing protein